MGNNNYNYSRNNSYIRNRYKKNYCFINIKSTWNYNINFRFRKSYIILFSSFISCFFKAILFICAGIIIHNIKDYQDIRKIGISKNFIPIVSSVMLIANISLCGLPFLRGFYSKDIILELIIIKGINILIIV